MPASGHLTLRLLRQDTPSRAKISSVRCWCYVHLIFRNCQAHIVVEALPDRPSSSGLGGQGPCQHTPAHRVLANRCSTAWCQTARSLERSSSSDQPSSLSCLRYAPQFSVGALPIPSSGTLLRETGTWLKPQQCSGRHLRGDSSFSLTV